MFRFINSLQVVGLFVAMPWIIGWLFNADFPFANVASWAACCGYALLGWLMVAAVFNLSEDWK